MRRDSLKQLLQTFQVEAQALTLDTTWQIFTGSTSVIFDHRFSYQPKNIYLGGSCVLSSIGLMVQLSCIRELSLK